MNYIVNRKNDVHLAPKCRHKKYSFKIGLVYSS